MRSLFLRFLHNFPQAVDQKTFAEVLGISLCQIVNFELVAIGNEIAETRIRRVRWLKHRSPHRDKVCPAPYK